MCRDVSVCLLVVTLLADDTNKDNLIDFDELVTLLVEVELEATDAAPDLGAVHSRCRSYFGSYDTNKNRALDFHEFVQLIFRQPELLGTAVMLRSYFAAADTNKDDGLSSEELRGMMAAFYSDKSLPISESELAALTARIMLHADTNKDGVVDYKEFVAYFVRSEEPFPLFKMLLSICSEDNGLHDYYNTSFLKELVDTKKNAMGLTSVSEPEIAACCFCLAPLIGKEGTMRFDLTFCSLSCQTACVDLADMRAMHLRMYNKAGMRKVNLQDYEWRSSGSSNKKHHRDWI